MERRCHTTQGLKNTNYLIYPLNFAHPDGRHPFITLVVIKTKTWRRCIQADLKWTQSLLL